MPPKYKIFYTDRTTLLSTDLPNDGDPKDIAQPQRIGVHSIIQEMVVRPEREVIEQYHYIFSIRDQQWNGLGLDGLLDILVNDFADIRCVLNGRTMPTERFWDIKQTARADTDIVGSVTTARVADTFDSLMHTYNDPHYQASLHGGYDEFYDWTDFARHRPYDERFAESHPYGLQEFYH